MQELLDWYDREGRDLPWRSTRDPYKVLVSEIMLQQTQVSRVIPKYEWFVARWPDFHSLAQADRRDVLRLWQGLGYNSRAARLHTLAALVVERYDGMLPRDREALLALPGIGPYTAGAIQIFAFDEPAPSMDVNIERVVRRVFYSKEDRPERRDLERRQEEMIRASDRPHDLHSALMDLGSICTARDPACAQCPLNARCTTRGEHPAERRRLQGTFAGSNRWWRGRILATLLDSEMDASTLLAAITQRPTEDEREAFMRALASLRDEGLVEGEGALRIKA